MNNIEITQASEKLCVFSCAAHLKSRTQGPSLLFRRNLVFPLSLAAPWAQNKRNKKQQKFTVVEKSTVHTDHQFFFSFMLLGSLTWRKKKNCPWSHERKSNARHTPADSTWALQTEVAWLSSNYKHYIISSKSHFKIIKPLKNNSTC